MKTTVNAAWLIGCRITADILSFLLFVTISRHFGPHGIGLYAYGFALATIGFVIGALGIEGYGVREYTRLESTHGSALIAELIGTQALVVILTVLGLVLYLGLTGASASVVSIVALLGTFQLALAFSHTMFIPAIAQQAMIGPAVIELCCRGGAILYTIGSICFLHTTLLWALIGYPIFAVIMLVAAAWMAHRFNGSLAVSMKRKAIVQQLTMLWSFAAAEAMVQVFIRTGLIVLTLFSGTEVSGIYATGLKFLEIALMPLVFLGLAMYPSLSRLSHIDPPQFTHACEQLLRMAMLMSGTVAWALYFIFPVLLVPLLGDRFAATIPVMHLMTGLALMQAGEIALVRVLLAADRQIARFRCIAWGTVLNLVLMLVLVPRWQITGAVAAGIIALAAVDLGYAICVRGAVRWAVARAAGGAAFGLVVAIGLTWIVRESGGAYWVQSTIFIVGFLAVAATFGWLLLGRTPRASGDWRSNRSIHERLSRVPTGCTCPGVHRAVVEYLLDTGRDMAGLKLLDIPCGEGELMGSLRQFFPEAELRGCDVQKPKALADDDFSFVDANRPFRAFPAMKFDFVLCVSGVMEFDNTLQFVETCRDHLQTGGQFIVSNDSITSVRDRIAYFWLGKFSPFSIFVTQNLTSWKVIPIHNLVRILRDAGLVIREVRYVSPQRRDWLMLPLALLVYPVQFAYMHLNRTKMPRAERRVLYPFRSLVCRHYLIICEKTET